MARLSNTLALTTLLTLRAAASDGTFPDDLELKTYTSYTEALPLAVGEVANKFHTLNIPSGPIAVYEFKADVVEKDPETEEYIPVPLNEAYLHHHVVGSKHKAYKHLEHVHTPMKPKGMYKGVGFGAGSEARGTPQKFYYPFAFTTHPDEDSWVANVHVINTRHMTTEEAHRCLECPCTSEDFYGNGTIKDTKRGWNGCNDFLAIEMDNDACYADTYKGGLRCCEDREFCMEKSALSEESPISTFYLRYTLTYADFRPTNRPLGLAACCDVTGDVDRTGNIEYDIPQCEDPVNKAEECVYELTTVQQLHSGNNGAFGIRAKIGVETPNEYLDVVYMVGHMHRGGIDIEIKDAETDEVICLSKPSYGRDMGIAGDEKDYVVAMSTCTFNPPRRMSTTDLVKVTARYDSTEAHTGVMSLFYIATADPIDDENAPDVPMLGATLEEESQEAEIASADNADAPRSSFKSLFVTFSVIAICVVSVKKFGLGRKKNYTPIEGVDISV
uniref:Copper type II ascorbate-dependent monooxygenase C-terminal domain-containing protein n=1 Tax=Helicotheca tamesis TaxID=374047 RepID=A0A7S2MVH9_9STRA|mmetsp:Transcript_4182/g.5682  ORF Transcript_4182/g.5682 Transcript_4182/m.5682 type:complete len:501 (+) Transcript_4182:114-1616(+)|eukprot:CAMPEP_0185730814 /NCGR_PEP_ID=MMETSP1171-20130828/11067_1 /TAXON_ID=374046 /ORGANISM="Helicotheca tamensis, Strain CCMP826" /LENGTH=500 /DNA_ID=CAMNT_0028399949 /DNA_START=92 /DNA_END=1594 /DNA_ORIENTATION=+